MPKILPFGLGEGSDSVAVYIFSLCGWSEVKGNSVCFAWLYKVRSFHILALLPYGARRIGESKAQTVLLGTGSCPQPLIAASEWDSRAGLSAAPLHNDLPRL